MASGFPQLQSLNINNFNKITDEGIRALVNGLLQLQSFNIRDCDHEIAEGINSRR